MKANRVLFLFMVLFVAASVAAEAEAPHVKWGAIPLIFEPNRGQAATDVRFMSRGNGYGLFFTDNEAIVSFVQPRQATVRMKLAGQNPKTIIEALEVQPGESHYFLGADRQGWQNSVPHFGRILYRSVYPGIDLSYYGNQRQLEYDFTLAPGANPASIKLDFSGVDALSINEQGDLVLQTSVGNILHRRPTAYQDRNGVRTSVPVQFALRGDHQAGFDLGDYDADRPLTIDPTLAFSTYFGGSAIGSAGDQGNAIALDPQGNVYVTGFTTSTDFASGLTQGPAKGALDAFVMKVSADGSTLFTAAYIGGSADDEGHDIALDAAGNIFIVGYSSSPNFPIVNGFQSARGGGQDAFLVKLNNAATTILYSTWLGGSQDDRALGVAVDPTGNAYVTGLTGSRNFPVRTPLQPQMGGGLADVFAAKFSPDGSLVYSTYIGGVGLDQAYDIAVDSDGNAYITGNTTSLNFPTAVALLPQFRGGSDDIFVSKINPLGSALLFSTFLGGTGTDYGVRIALDADRNVYVTGYTSSADFPVTANALQLGLAAELDAFLVKLSSDGTQVPYSSYIGSDGTESGVGLALDAEGNVYLAGFTSSFQFYTVNPIQKLLNNGAAVLTRDAFVMKLKPDLSHILYSTYLGGLNNDGAVGLAVDAAGIAYVTGYSTSADFPVTNAFQPQNNGGQDGFLAKIDASDIKTSLPFLVSSQGGAVVQTDSGTTDPLFGYAAVDLEEGTPRPTGMAIIALRQVSQLVSEVAIPLTPFIQNGRMFVELGGTTINTVLTLMNPGDEEVTVNFYFTDVNGNSENFGTAVIPAKGVLSRFLTDDPYNILTDTSGALTFDTSGPVAAAGFRTFSNEAGNFILSNAPIADPYLANNSPVTIPGIADSLGWNTQIILVNTTEDTMTGELRFFGPGNSEETGPLDVTIGDVLNGMETNSVFAYEIPPRSVKRFITANANDALVSGFAAIVPDAGTFTPAAHALVSFAEGSATEVQTSIEAQVPKSSLRLFAETSGNFAESEALSIRTAVALVNPSDSAAAVRLELTGLDGTATGLSAQVAIPPHGEFARFLDEIAGFENIPNPFTGVLKVSVTSGAGVTALGMRTRAKEFGGFLATTTGPIREDSGSGSTVIFPHIAEGGGYTTDFILLTGPGGQGSSGVIRFVNTTGEPLDLSVH